jgi:hypothetical protein
MTVAGLRDRLLKDSFFALVQQALSVLGWLDPGRQHRPLTLTSEPNHWDVPVTPNTVTVDFTGSSVSEWEVGSRLTSDLHIGYVEIYAENDSLGTHLANDLRDWLRGRLHPQPGVTFPIFDFSQGSTPPVIGHMDIGAVSALRNVAANEDVWIRHWFRVRCEIRDTYASGKLGTYPSSALVPADVLFPAS